jgi:hypothetical protein
MQAVERAFTGGAKVISHLILSLSNMTTHKEDSSKFSTHSLERCRYDNVKAGGNNSMAVILSHLPLRAKLSSLPVIQSASGNPAQHRQ